MLHPGDQYSDRGAANAAAVIPAAAANACRADGRRARGAKAAGRVSRKPKLDRGEPEECDFCAAAS